MGRTRGEVLARSIVAKLDALQQLSEEILRRLIGLVAETVVKDIDGGVDRGLVELEQDVSARYAASGVEQMEGFSLGACWGILEVLRAVSEIASESDALLQCAEVVRRHLSLFQMVGERPGVAQGELADALGEKKSNFSQKLARLGKYQMISVSIVGKSKHLYLTRRGEESLRRVLAEMDDRTVSGSMSNMTLRTLDARELAFDENGSLVGHLRAVWVSMTENENAGRSVVDGRNAGRVGTDVRYSVEYLSSTQQTDRSRVDNWINRNSSQRDMTMNILNNSR